MDDASRKIVTKIENCVELLEDHQTKLLDSVAKTDRGEEIRSLMTLRGFKFAIAGMRTVLHMVDDRDKAIFAACVIRPVYEVAIKILWAAPKEHGCHMLRNESARQKLTLIRETEGDPQLAAMVEKMKQHLESLRNEKTASGDEITKKLPQMQKMLDEIDMQDKSTDFAESHRMWRSQYGTIYIVLCGPSHADPLDIGADYDRLWPTIERASVLATHALLMVFLIVTIPNQKALKDEVTQLENRMDELFGA